MKFQKPLAYRARPKKLEEIVGQEHIIGPTGVIKRRLDNEQPMTFLEFNYTLLQSYDYLELYRRRTDWQRECYSGEQSVVLESVELTLEVEALYQ